MYPVVVFPRKIIRLPCRKIRIFFNVNSVAAASNLLPYFASDLMEVTVRALELGILNATCK